MAKKVSLFLLVLAFAAYSPSLFAQGTGRIHQSIVINGQAADGVFLIQGGTVQGTACANPQPYQTVDGSSSGYACFDVPSGAWLLNAQPAYTEPNTVYVPTPTYSSNYYPSYSYSYPYYSGGYSYPYYSGAYYGGGYPYYWGPGFGLGLGFAYGRGFRNYGFVGNRPFVDHRGFGRGAFVGRPGGAFVGTGFRGGAFRGGGFHGGGGFRGGGFRGGGFHGGGGGFRGGGGGFRGGGRR